MKKVSVIPRKSKRASYSRDEVEEAMKRYLSSGGQIKKIETKSEGISLSKAFPKDYHADIYGDGAGEQSDFPESL